MIKGAKKPEIADASKTGASTSGVLDSDQARGIEAMLMAAQWEDRTITSCSTLFRGKTVGAPRL